MSNRRRLKGSWAVAEPVFRSVARSQCGECRSRRLRWLTPGEAAAAGLDLAYMEEALAGSGGVASVWQCADCGHYGAFGPIEHG